MGIENKRNIGLNCCCQTPNFSIAMVKPVMDTPIRAEKMSKTAVFLVRNMPPQVGHWNFRGFFTFNANANDIGELHFGQFMIYLHF